MKTLLAFGVLLLSGLAVQSQTNPCADPHAPRVSIHNTSPSAKASKELAGLLEPVDRFVDALERQFYGACVVKDESIFSDPKNFPALNGSLVLTVNAMPSVKHKGFVAVSVEFSVLRGVNILDRMTMFVCPVLLTPDDTESDINTQAKSCVLGYDGIVEGVSKKPDGH